MKYAWIVLIFSLTSCRSDHTLTYENKTPQQNQITYASQETQLTMQLDSATMRQAAVPSKRPSSTEFRQDMLAGYIVYAAFSADAYQRDMAAYERETELIYRTATIVSITLILAATLIILRSRHERK